MQINTASPQQIDTELAVLYRELAVANQEIERTIEGLHYALEERKRFTGTRGTRRGQWPTTTAQAIVKLVNKVADPAYTEAGPWTPSAIKALEAYDAAVARRAAVLAEMAPLEAEYDSRPWSRFFTVPGGHIHSSMNCSTCNRGQYATEFGWNPELSGQSEGQAVAAKGPALCTVCFPSAPVEWTAGIKKNHCEGSAKSPVKGSVKRWGMSAYGTCTGCDTRQTVTQFGVIRRHPQAEAKVTA